MIEHVETSLSSMSVDSEKIFVDTKLTFLLNSECSELSVFQCEVSPFTSEQELMFEQLWATLFISTKLTFLLNCEFNELSVFQREVSTFISERELMFEQLGTSLFSTSVNSDLILVFNSEFSELSVYKRKMSTLTLEQELTFEQLWASLYSTSNNSKLIFVVTKLTFLFNFEFSELLVFQCDINFRTRTIDWKTWNMEHLNHQHHSTLSTYL